ncbi:30S ribosomal protein S18 [Haliovirga abyssi]|uniref:Small ribosomal subunit protein bS18 n=1 Tax=Haliovirga abyssi TaxID=2996794 RepID=A0AAU9DBI8_9FUSO|nr:30S ribosomal protein S18 [Haliovirga abyssi]BDU49607.1 30S ribosomal protein S18 [Haliovirga abyssi]
MRRENDSRKRKKKQCDFCKNKKAKIDYKNVDMLKRYLSDKGKISPARVTGACAKHQRALTQAIKRARNIALLPYTVEN